MAKTPEVSFTIRAKDAFSAVMKQAENSVSGVTSRAIDMKSAFVGLFAGFSVAVLVKDLLDLGAASDKAMRQITSNLPTGVAGIRQLKGEIQSLAVESGRSLDEMQNAAVEISRLGVANAGEVALRLKAANTFANATGLDLTATVQGLDQLMDTFNIDAEQAKQVLADLASAAKGRVDVESLFGAFAKVSPVVHELGLDAQTTTKALVALLDAGMTAKQAGAFLEKLDKTGVQQLAAQAHIAADAMEQLEARSKTTTDGIGRQAQGLKAQWSGIGQNFADAWAPATGALIGWLAQATKVWSQAQQLMAFKFARGEPASGPAEPTPVAARDVTGEGGVSPSRPSNFVLPLTDQQKAAIRSVRDELNQLGIATQKDIAGATKSAVDDAKVDLAAYVQQIAKMRADIQNNKELPGGSKAADIAELNAKATAEIHRRQMAITALSAKQDAENMKGIRDAFAGLSTNVLDEFDSKVADALDKARESLKGITNENARAFATARIDEFTDKMGRLRIATAAVSDASKDEAQIERLLFAHPDEPQTYITALERYDAILTTLRASQAKLTEGSEEWQAEQEKIKHLLEASAQAFDQYFKKFPNFADASSANGDAAPLKDEVRNVKELVSAWVDVGRSIIAASQALGAMDDKTAATLQNVASLAEGIGRMFAGDETGGAVQSITSIGALLGTLTGNTPAEKARQEALKANTVAIIKLTEKGGLLNGVNLSGSDAASATRMVNAILGQIHGVHISAKVNGLTPEQGDFLRDVAQKLGITIDDTVGSFVKLQQALETSFDRLGEFGSAFDDVNAELDASKKIFGDKGPLADLQSLLKGQGQNNATFAAFGGMDLSTAEGQAKLRSFVEGTFAQMQSGGGKLDPATLGNLSGSEFLQTLEQIIEYLNQLAPAAKTASETLSDAMAAVDQSIAINDITDPIEQFAKRADVYKQAGGALGDFLAQFDLTNADGIAAMDKALPAFLEKIKANPDAFDTAGLSITDFINILLGLDTAADSVANGIQSAIGKINDATNQLSDNFTINDITDPTKQLGYTVGAATGKDSGLDAVLQGSDTTTASGRSALKKKLQDFYAGHPEFGGIIAGIVKQINAIDAVTPGTSDGAAGGVDVGGSGATSASSSAFVGLTTMQGDQLLDLARRQMTRLDLLVPINNALQSMVTRVALPSPVSFSGALANGGVQITAPFTVQVHTAAEDAETQGTLIGDAIVRELDAKFGRSTILQKLLRGNVAVAG